MGKLQVGAWIVIALLMLGLAAISLNRRITPHRPTTQLPSNEPDLTINTEPPSASASASVPPAPRQKRVTALTTKNVLNQTAVMLRNAAQNADQGNAGAPQPELANLAVTSSNPAALAPASLEIEVEHKFPAAHLTIWVDNRLAYTRMLTGNDKKTLGVFHHVAGHEFHAMPITSGKHQLRVQVTAAAGAGSAAFRASSNLEGVFSGTQENVLHVTFAKNGEMNLSLR